MSDANGYTGQGALTEQDPTLQQDPLADQSDLPPRVQIPQSAFPQNGGDRRFSPSAFPATGNEPGPPSGGSQLPPIDPGIERLRQATAEAAPNAHPSKLRQIFATIASLHPLSSPFVPMIEGQDSAQMREYGQRQRQLPQRIQVEQLASQERNRQAMDADRDEARLARIDQAKQNEAVNQQNEQGRFEGRGGEILTPQKMDMGLSPMDAPQQEDTSATVPGPQMPQMPLSNGRGMSSLPPRVTIPPMAQVPRGYNVEPSARYDPSGSMRAAPSLDTRKRMDTLAKPITSEAEMAAIANDPNDPRQAAARAGLSDMIVQSQAKLPGKQPAEPLPPDVEQQRIRMALAEHNPTSDAGTWQLAEDSNGKPVEHNTKTGEVRPVSGDIQPRGTKDKKDAAQEKLVGPSRDALEYAQNYIQSGAFTGPGDEALLEKFFELAKPSTGFRMTKQQLDMLKDSRSWMGSISAKVRHATTGTWFADDQRKQIAQTMGDLAKAKGVGGGGSSAASGPKKSDKRSYQGANYTFDGTQWVKDK